MQYFYLTIIAFTLVACGGNSSSPSTKETLSEVVASETNTEEDLEGVLEIAEEETPEQTPTPTPSAHTNEVEVAETRALSLNSVISPEDVNVYTSKTIHFPLSQIDFKGDLRFVKVETALNQVLFLGQLPSNTDSALSFHIELAGFPVYVEVFSEHIEDTIQSWSVNYND